MRYLRIPHRYEHFRKVVRGSAPLLCRSALRIFLAVALLVAATSPLLAQQFATLNVTVADPSGSVIAGAPVSVRNNDTGILRTELTDKVGLAVIPGLPRRPIHVDCEHFILQCVPSSSHPDLRRSRFPASCAAYPGCNPGSGSS